MDKSKIKQNIVPIIAAVVALVSIVFLASSNANNSKVLTAQREKITQLRSDLAVKEASAELNKAQIRKASTGVDAERKTKDDQKAEEMFRTALSWSSYSEYMAARTKLMQVYGFTSDSPMLKTIMPEVKDSTDANGKHYNEIDTLGRNSTFDKMESRVSAINATTYSYFAVVSASTRGGTDKAVAKSYYVVTYAIDADGAVSKVTLTPMPQAPTTVS